MLSSLQGGPLSSASRGHLWVCPGPPQHRMGLCHPLVAYKGWQACRGFEMAASKTPAPGKAGECLQPAPCPNIPASAFCSRVLGEAVHPRRIGSPAALLPYESRISIAISCPSGSILAKEELPSIGTPLLAPRSRRATESVCESFRLGCFKALLPSRFRWLEISYPIPNPPKSQLGNEATPASKTEGDSFSFI